MFDEFQIKTSPYARRILAEMQAAIEEEREKYKHLSDEEFREHVKNQIKWDSIDPPPAEPEEGH